MMYASKIKIDYNPKIIRYERSINLPDRLLTIEDISKHLKDGEKFSFKDSSEDIFTESTILHIVGSRIETKEEMKLRISKQEKYNENYEIHHAKYGRKKTK